MIGDLVCDDMTNTEECEYDGGDCCLPHKSTPLCIDNCDCILTVDNDFLADAFDKHKVFQSMNVDDYKDSKLAFDIEVTDVVSIGVCAMICFETGTIERVNYWSYSSGSRTCKCSWIIADINCWTVGFLNKSLKATPWLDFDSDISTAFVLTARSVSCGNIYVLD